MLDRRRMLAAAVAAMTCPLGGVLALAQPAAPSGPSLVVPARRALAALPLDGARPSRNRPPMPPPCHEVRPPPPRGPHRWHWSRGRWRWYGRRWVWCPGDGAENADPGVARRKVTALRFEPPSRPLVFLGPASAEPPGARPR